MERKLLKFLPNLLKPLKYTSLRRLGSSHSMNMYGVKGASRISYFEGKAGIMLTEVGH